MAVQNGSAVGATTRKKAVVAAVIGNFVEWYDFVIYACFATLFFPSEDRFVSPLPLFGLQRAGLHLRKDLTFDLHLPATED